MNKQNIMNAKFQVIDTENKENKLLKFLKENYPSVVKDNEINLQELKTILGLPVDEKVNGYGLNFVGRNVARAKYAQKTDKELKLNTDMSKNIDTTQNLVLKGDNLDCLKILKNYYSGKIKCIYIDPPYNTDSDEFVYPDKFNKEEAEVLGLTNLSNDDFKRMEFAFKTKKSHNGWLAFMYPRLLLARDLLSDDGVIFISIDDNEQANLKLLCDEIFGEENFVATFIWTTKKGAQGMITKNLIVPNHEYIITYAKNSNNFRFLGLERDASKFSNPDNDPRGPWKRQYLQRFGKGFPKRTLVNPKTRKTYEFETPYTQEKLNKWVTENVIIFPDSDNGYPARKEFLSEYKENKQLITYLDLFPTKSNTEELNKMFENVKIFTNPKPTNLIKHLLKIGSNSSDIILDFFAGSGTTGQAVMELNAEDGGNRKFILVQIDEPINTKHPAYKFCIDNKLPPVISSITIERLRRAGEKIKKEIEEENSKNGGLPEENQKKVPDIGFKVFDTVEAPKLNMDENGQVLFPEPNNDALSRIYNMIFTVGLDEPTQVPEEIVKDCVYKIGDHYYITNSDKVSKKQFAECIKNGKVFIDGWTANLNTTLQHYKEEIKIVF